MERSTVLIFLFKLIVVIEVLSSISHNTTLPLTLLVPEKLKNSIFEMAMIIQILNINKLRTTSAKSINLYTIGKLIEYSFKKCLARQCLLLLFLKHCCPKKSRFCDPPSGA